MFRPCIDLHEGKVKQLVGGTYSDEGEGLRTRFISERDPAWYAGLFKQDGLQGGHVILIGAGNEHAAREALQAYPGGLQVGGGINQANASTFLEWGASHVILTSWLFPDGKLDMERVRSASQAVGRERLVIDLSCRRRDDHYHVMINRWQTWTDQVLCEALIQQLEPYCDEFLIHAVDMEGKCEGIDLALVRQLSSWGSLPITYAGGARSFRDLENVQTIGEGRLHLTIGSALDIFGGQGVAYADAVAFNQRVQEKS